MSERIQVQNDGKSPYTSSSCRDLNYILHVHSTIEIFICMDGELNIVINDKVFTITKGQCVVINAHMPHGFYTADGKGNLLQGLNIRDEDFYRNTRGFIDPDFAALIFNAYESKTLLNIGKKLMKVDNDPFPSLTVLSSYLGILSEILNSGKYHLVKGSNVNPTINYILQYVIKEMKKDITLDDISKDLCISKFYVSHIFSEVIHVNFKNYLNSLRLSAAKRLLVQSDEDIGTIAASCGFESIRTFNRDFNKMFNQTPTQFRKEGKDDSVYLDISSPLFLVENSLKNQVR